MRQIATIKPKALVALGAVAAKTLLAINAPMSELRGKWYDFRGTKLAVTYHPAFLLRDPRQKKEAWKDLQMVMKDLGLVAPPKSPSRLPTIPHRSTSEDARAYIDHARILRRSSAGCPLDIVFTYAVPEGMQPVVGGRVLVPFRQQRMSGIVTAVHQ